LHGWTWEQAHPILKNNLVIQKKVKKIQIFLGIKDDHVLYSYTKDSPWNNFSCCLDEKNRLGGPILKYYSRYIRHRFVFFCLKSMWNISWPNKFIRVQYLIIFDSQKDSNFFWLYLKLLHFLEYIGCACTREPKVRVTSYILYCLWIHLLDMVMGLLFMILRLLSCIVEDVSMQGYDLNISTFIFVHTLSILYILWALCFLPWKLELLHT
jgi:hypothetical protein